MIHNHTHTHTINTHKSNLLEQQFTNQKPPTEPTPIKTLLRKIHQDKTPPIQDVKLNLITSPIHVDPLDGNFMKIDLYESSRTANPSISTGQLSEQNVNNDGFQLNPEKAHDTKFINNVVVKEAFYRDKIKNTYQGVELDDKLKELDTIVNEVTDKISQNFAQYVGDFYNGKLADAAFADDLAEAYPKADSFDVAKFKQNVVQMISEQRKNFETIIQKNPGEWQKVIQSNGSNISTFHQQLETISSINSPSSPDLEDMSYNDMKATVDAIKLINVEMNSSGSRDIMSSVLGLAKAKSEIYLETAPLSDSMKNSIRNAVDKNIQVKNVNMDIEKILGDYFWENHGFGTKTVHNYLNENKSNILNTLKENNTRPNDFFTMFANLKNCNRKYFLQTFLHHLSALKAELTKPTAKISGVSADEYVSDEQKSHLADTITDQISQNWNNFINTLNVDKNTKDQYFLPASNNNVIDVSI